MLGFGSAQRSPHHNNKSRRSVRYRADAAANAGRVIRCEVEDLVAGLDEILNDEAGRSRMAAKGKELAFEKYSWERIAGEVLSLYRRCIEQRARAGRAG